jgi:cellulose synthase/poly-beta-1,6-N-acetylglucosamine synthase-like glycosyltransferase
MAMVLSIFLIALSAFLTVPILIFLVEILAAISQWGSAEDQSSDDNSTRVAVLVPAHNESAGIAETVAQIKSQLRPADRLLVIADNCSDDTAQVAARAGAEVTRRDDPTKIGKGYALDWGVRLLAADAPDVVMVVDADCRPSAGSVGRLAEACVRSGRPAQALDLLIAPADSAVNLRVAEFAWRVKNWMRPLGLKALGLPCQLMGTGMAFPWDVIRTANLASGHIVEDLKLGLELVLAGHPAAFCPAARVTSYFPSSEAAAVTQRTRWEHGHIQLIVALAPRFLAAALTRCNVGLLALVLDLCVPPLSLLALLTVAAFLLAAIAALSGISPIPLVISAVSLVAFVTAVFLCWMRCGRDLLPPRAIAAIAPYVFGKIRIYGSLLVRKRVSQWVRTDRN